VVSSPLLRCRQTVEYALPGVEPVIEPDLTECGYGDWEGQALKTLAKEPLWRVVQQHPSAVTFPGAEGESMAAMSARAVAAVRGHDERVAAEHGPDALWLACSHGDVIKAIVAGRPGVDHGDPLYPGAAIRRPGQRHRRGPGLARPATGQGAPGPPGQTG
jgi:broad specificity phosphatase PhoE